MAEKTCIPRRRALLVEDSVISQKLMTFMLGNEGFDVVLAANGRDGVDQFVNQSFDIVIMDIQMPLMDGLQATRLIREHEKLTGKRTPIVAVTAEMDRGSCMQADLDEYLEKPVQLAEFHEAIERVCSGPNDAE